MRKHLQPDGVHCRFQQNLHRNLPKHKFMQMFSLHSIKRKVKVTIMVDFLFIIDEERTNLHKTINWGISKQKNLL